MSRYAASIRLNKNFALVTILAHSTETDTYWLENVVVQ